MAYIFGKYFFGIWIFLTFSKVGGLLRLYSFPLNEEGPVHTIYYILVHLEQKELFPSMQIICQDSSTVFWQSQRQIFARYTHKHTLSISLYPNNTHCFCNMYTGSEEGRDWKKHLQIFLFKKGSTSLWSGFLAETIQYISKVDYW